MRIKGPEYPQGYPERAKPILRHKIEEAIANTVSNSAAARYLGVSSNRYKKYASIYGLYEGHNNRAGFGTSKGFAKSKKSVPLKKIFNNEYPKYSLNRLKGRLFRRGLLEEKCYTCGFNEKRYGDDKSPLLLTFKEAFRDFTQSNLTILCYNCMFLISGSPQVAHSVHIKSSLIKHQEEEEDTTSYPKNYNRVEGNIDDFEDVGNTIDKVDFNIAKFQNDLLKELKQEKEI